MGDNIHIKQIVKDVIQFRDGILEGGVLSSLEHTLVTNFFRYYMDGEISPKEEDAECCTESGCARQLHPRPPAVPVSIMCSCGKTILSVDEGGLDIRNTERCTEKHCDCVCAEQTVRPA